MKDESRKFLEQSYEKLQGYLLECAQRAKTVLKNGIETIASSEGHYYGIWPDDFLFPHIVCPQLADVGKLAGVMEFLTESVVDLERVPDRVEPDGLPIMFPGWYDCPIGGRMPAHLPAAWVRLLSYMEEWGINIPRKDRWARVIKRSFEQVSFSCGLVYIDPQKPYVGFGYQDNIAITGFTLMSSCAIYRGLQRAVELFRDYLPEGLLNYWRDLAQGIKANLFRLYDDKIGGFVAGSKDCHQFDVWGNGLVYGLTDDENIKNKIQDSYLRNWDRIIRFGFTRQIAEEKGWQRLLVSAELGKYMNGGYWSTGTGYILPVVFAADEGRAINLLKELLENLPRFHFAEWVDAQGKEESSAKCFLMGIAIPMLGIKAILEDKPLINYF
ncbi:MAG: hypothetical protein ACPL7E_00490 [bacterium]